MQTRMKQINFDEIEIGTVQKLCQEVIDAYKPFENASYFFKPGAAGKRRFIRFHELTSSINDDMSGLDALCKLYQFYADEKKSSRLNQFVVLAIACALELRKDTDGELTGKHWKETKKLVDNIMKPVVDAKLNRNNTSHPANLEDEVDCVVLEMSPV